MSADDFRTLLADAHFRSQVAPHKLEVLETLAGNSRGHVTYQDLVSVVSTGLPYRYRALIPGTARLERLFESSQFRTGILIGRALSPNTSFIYEGEE